MIRNLLKRIKENFLKYLNVQIPGHQRSSEKYSMYFQIFFIFNILITIPTLLLSRPIAFKIIYPFITTICFTSILFLIFEWIIRRKEQTGEYQKPTVRVLWLIAIFSYIPGYAIYRKAEYDLVPFYYSDASLELISKEPVIFIRMLPFWLLAILLFTLFKLKSEFHKQKEKVLPEASLFLPLYIDVMALKPELIRYISVEEHYSRITFWNNHKYEEIVIRLALKEVLKNLQGNHFIQIHRSTIVNLSFVTELKKLKNSYEVIIDKGAFRLPASRHRMRPMLDQVQGWISSNNSISR